MTFVIHKLYVYMYFFISVYLGHTLLERYGMTEIGMALSNSLHGPRLPVRYCCSGTWMHVIPQPLSVCVIKF